MDLLFLPLLHLHLHPSRRGHHVRRESLARRLDTFLHHPFVIVVDTWLDIILQDNRIAEHHLVHLHSSRHLALAVRLLHTYEPSSHRKVDAGVDLEILLHLLQLCPLARLQLAIIQGKIPALERSSQGLDREKPQLTLAVKLVQVSLFVEGQEKLLLL